MNMNQIRIYTKNALLIVLSMIVMAGITGLSYKAHYCHGNLSGIAFYSELNLQQTVSCGCKGDAIPENNPESGDLSVLTKNSCCSNISFFSKLNIESQYNFFSSLVLIKPVISALFVGNNSEPGTEKESLQASDFRFYPPPLAGRKLVLFLSQQRIPLISYNC